jgi:prophage antirepressor-like protein
MAASIAGGNKMTNNVKIEIWNGHAIRFVEKDSEWWAAAADIAEALELENVRVELSRMPEAAIYKCYISSECCKGKSGQRKGQKVNILSEKGLYRLIMRSNKPEALAFQDWVYGLLKSLREAAGLEQWQTAKFIESAQNKRLNMGLLKEAFNPKTSISTPRRTALLTSVLRTLSGNRKR